MQLGASEYTLTTREFLNKEPCVKILRLAILLLCLATYGCSQPNASRVNATAVDQIPKEILRVRALLPPVRGGEFEDSAYGLVLEATRKHASDRTLREKAAVEAVQGKTAEEIIAEFAKLPGDVRKPYVYARDPVTGESVRDANKYLAKADTISRKLLENPPTNQDPRFKRATVAIRKAYIEKKQSGDALAAAKWYCAQYMEKTPAELAEEFGKENE